MIYKAHNRHNKKYRQGKSARDNDMACICKRIRNLILILLWARIGIQGQSEQLTEIPVPELPQETIDTLIIRPISHGYKTWLEVCLNRNPAGERIYEERDACEKEIIRNLILTNLEIDINGKKGKVKIEYVVEKNRTLGWIRIKDDTTEGELGKYFKDAFERIRYRLNDLRWSYPSSRFRLTRILKEVEIVF